MTTDVEGLSNYVEFLTDENPNLLVPWYLIGSYAYYILDNPVLTDACYDAICQRLHDALDCFIIEHDHMHLCDFEALAAGSGYHLSEDDYPSRVKSVVARIHRGEEI